MQDVINERLRQLDKHGDQSHLPDGTGPKTLLEALPAIPSWKYRSNLRANDLAKWAKARCKAASQNEDGNGTITYEQILTEEWAEAIAEEDPTKLREELIQVAAVCIAWAEKLDQGEKEKANG
jgi:hypothetical protein